jgi:hypothetical protein
LKQSHLNTYELEKIKDKYLMDIKAVCVLYLENKTHISHINNDKILECHKYILSAYEELDKLKQSLKVQTYNSPYYEIYSNLDSMILNDNLIGKQEKVTFIELTKDINYLADIIAFCYGILGLILKDRNL